MYEVSGPASSASIQYYDSKGETVIRRGVALPWSDTFYVANGFTASLVAKVSTTESNKSITAKLYVDGELVDESSGNYYAVVYEWICTEKIK